jgi:hypothetical protein
MSRLVRLIVPLSILLALGAVGWLLLRGAPRLPDIPLAARPAPLERPAAVEPLEGMLPTPESGGIVTGRVVGEGDLPVAGARVLLVRYNAGDPRAVAAYREQLERDGIPDPTLIPTVGDHLLAGETKADGEGRFSIAAGGDAYITHIVAYHPGWFPEVVDLRDIPRDARGNPPPLLVRLERGGRLIGRVLDDETGEPIPRARVDLLLQQIARRLPGIPTGADSGEVRGDETAAVPRSAMATLGRFLPKVLGERIWGISDVGSDGLVVWADENGSFEVGPLGPDVQIEIIITHPDYAWTDMDNPDHRTQPQRTIVRAGETVTRELRLRRGGVIAGRVVDRVTGEGFEGALVEVESVSAYFKHWWYARKRRRALTDREGRFRVAGLAIGSQSIIVSHPTFGKTYKPGVEPGETDIVIAVSAFGGIDGTVVGFEDRPPGGQIRVHLERLMEDGRAQADTEKGARLDLGGRFQLAQIEPGDWRVWLQVGKLASLPQTLTLVPREMTQATFELGGGGGIQVAFVDTTGRMVDPVTVHLMTQAGEGDHTLGTFVSRSGELDVEGVLPGHYRLGLRAHGYVPAYSEPFEVARNRTAHPVVPPLERYGDLVLGPLLDPRGDPYGGAAGPVVIELRIGGEAAPWKRFLGTLGRPLEVVPGPVAVRARVVEAGWSAEARAEVRGGSTTRLELRLRGS